MLPCRQDQTTALLCERAKAETRWPRNRKRIPKRRPRTVPSAAVAPKGDSVPQSRRFVARPTPMRQDGRAINNAWRKAGAKPPGACSGRAFRQFDYPSGDPLLDRNRPPRNKTIQRIDFDVVAPDGVAVSYPWALGAARPRSHAAFSATWIKRTAMRVGHQSIPARLYAPLVLITARTSGSLFQSHLKRGVPFRLRRTLKRRRIRWAPRQNLVLAH